MLTAEGCRWRRQKLWAALNPLPESDYLVLSDPIHLMYLAGFHADPISLNAGFGAFLVLRRDGLSRLILDNRMDRAAGEVHVDERRVVPWYDGQSPGQGPRQLACLESVNPSGHGFRVHDRPGDPYAQTLVGTLAKLRRRKDPDEINLLRRCMAATDAGHAWAREHVRPGMTELDVYSGISAACVRAAGRPAIVYGDFAVSPGPARRGGGPTDRVLQAGDMLILDFSVVLGGYRSDFTATLVVGGQPNPGQGRLHELCVAAVAAGEGQLRAGALCQTVYDAVKGVFDRAGMGEHFPHHAGHGLGLTHPEAPFFVRHSTETLLTGDVVTLEPGLYVPDVGGIRVEHNYLITDGGFERLSGHEI